MRLASGIAPIRKLIASGVRVGLGVDGSASNDAAQMMNEARQAMLLARVGRSLQPFGCDDGGRELSARDALRLATQWRRQRVLGRDDIGAIAPGMAADLALFRVDTLAMAGAVHDPVAAIMFCASPQAEYTIVNGRVVVREGNAHGTRFACACGAAQPAGAAAGNQPVERLCRARLASHFNSVAAEPLHNRNTVWRESAVHAAHRNARFPYVRRCAVSMAWLGIPFEHRSVSVFRHLIRSRRSTHW